MLFSSVDSQYVCLQCDWYNSNCIISIHLLIQMNLKKKKNKNVGNDNYLLEVYVIFFKFKFMAAKLQP